MSIAIINYWWWVELNLDILRRIACKHTFDFKIKQNFTRNLLSDVCVQATDKHGSREIANVANITTIECKIITEMAYKDIKLSPSYCFV